MKKTIDYLIRVHTLPHDLVAPLPPDPASLDDKRIWQLAIDTRLLWRVSDIDRFGRLWIDVDFENEDGEAEYHSLAIDEGCYRKHETDPYEVEFEELQG